jgi:hypothetical protein
MTSARCSWGRRSGRDQASPQDSCAFGKGVQLERDIADEVAPPAAARRSRIDKDRHRPILAHGRRRMVASPTKGRHKTMNLDQMLLTIRASLSATLPRRCADAQTVSIVESL